MRLYILSATLFFVLILLASELNQSRRLPFLTLTGALSLTTAYRDAKPAPESPDPDRNVLLHAAARPAPPISAESYLVQISGMRRPILKRLIRRPFSPASITKILTAYILRDRVEDDAWITFTKSAKSVAEKRSAAKVGDAFRRDDLVKLMIVASANDSAMAAAEFVGKRELKAGDPRTPEVVFHELMAQYAANIGLESAVFENPTGLDPIPLVQCADNAVSTSTPAIIPARLRCRLRHAINARDLLRLTEYIAVADKDLLELSTLRTADITTADGTTYKIESTNDLLSEFPTIRGGKTGTTDLAGETLLLLYQIDATRTATIILFRSADRFADARVLIRWIEDIFSDEERS